MKHSGRALIVAGFLAAAFCSNMAQAAKDKIVMRIGGDIATCNCDWEAPHTQAIEKIVKPRIKELTKGEVELQYFPATSGMGQKQLYEQMLLGAWEGVAITTAVLETYVPSIQIVSMPYIWSSFDHIHRVLDGKLGKKLERDALKKGFRILGWWHFPPRDILCRNPENVNVPSDLAGKKIRSMQSPVYVRTLKAYGAIPVPMEWLEVYMGMKQGVVDCVETSILPAYYMKHYEVTHTVVQVEQIYTMLVFAVSERWWSRLSRRNQEGIAKAVAEGTGFQRQKDEELYGRMIELWKKEGVRFIRPEREPFIKAARGTYPLYYDIVGKENIDFVLQQSRE